MIEHGGSIIGVLVDKAISPFPQGRLDKALRFPVGLGTVWPSEPWLESNSLYGGGKCPGTERRAIVSENGLGPHAQRGVPGVCLAEEIDRGFLGFIGIHPGESNAGMVIDGNKQHLPSCPAHLCRTITMDTVSGLFDAPAVWCRGGSDRRNGHARSARSVQPVPGPTAGTSQPD